MNILLVRPRPHKDSINLQSFMICEPLELEYAAAVAKEAGHQVDFVDLVVERKKLPWFLARKRYDLVGLTGYITHVAIIKDLAALVRKHDPAIVTVVGGVHAEVLPEDFQDADIDFILRLNALTSFKALLAGLAEGREGPAELRARIPGLWNGGPAQADCPLETSFSFPFPDRSISARYRHKYSYGFHNHCASIKTSFGCPYRCDFCFCVAITRHNYFERELPEVIEELQGIAEKNIFIVDDDFLLRRERVLEFCRLAREGGVRKNYILFGRADFIVENQDVLREFRDVGLQAVFVGVESFRQEDLDDADKRCTVETNKLAIKIIEDLGMLCYCGLLARHDWTPADFDALLEFLAEVRRPTFNLQPMTPMPGTPFYEKMKDRIIVPRAKYQLWDMAHQLLKPDHMGMGEFYKNILRVYYKRALTPRMHLRALREYGLSAYLRTLRGVFHISRQYLKLIKNPESA